MSSVHAHEVMHMMMESQTPFTRESLATAIAERFGSDAVFHSCSAEGMPIQELIAFLERRGKFIPKEGGFQVNSKRMCNH